jgi:Winged helix-turn-helix DNA-binding
LGTEDAATNVADLLSDIRRDIDRRLNELRPVRDEFRRLEQARVALAKANDVRRPARASKANDGSTRTRLTRAQSQEIDRRVLALLAEDSAQRPAALAILTETSVGSMNARLNRLVRDGELKKSKRGNTIRYQVPPGGDRAVH